MHRTPWLSRVRSHQGCAGRPERMRRQNKKSQSIVGNARISTCKATRSNRNANPDSTNGYGTVYIATFPWWLPPAAAVASHKQGHATQPCWTPQKRPSSNQRAELPPRGPMTAPTYLQAHAQSWRLYAYTTERAWRRGPTTRDSTQIQWQRTASRPCRHVPVQQQRAGMHCQRSAGLRTLNPVARSHFARCKEKPNNNIYQHALTTDKNVLNGKYASPNALHKVQVSSTLQVRSKAMTCQTGMSPATRPPWSWSRVLQSYYPLVPLCTRRRCCLMIPAAAAAAGISTRRRRRRPQPHGAQHPGHQRPQQQAQEGQPLQRALGHVLRRLRACAMKIILYMTARRATACDSSLGTPASSPA